MTRNLGILPPPNYAASTTAPNATRDTLAIVSAFWLGQVELLDGGATDVDAATEAIAVYDVVVRLPVGTAARGRSWRSIRA